AGKYPLVEEALALWISRANTALQTITDAIVKCKATQLTEGLEVTGFNASDGWLSNFKKRHHIKEYKHLGEAASAPLENLPRFCSELQKLIKKYKPEDVYNADETALYWRMESDKMLADGPVAGKKKPKTILLFIHKFKTPRALKNIDKSTLPVYYYWNRTIHNCWRKTGILPESFLSELFPHEEPDQANEPDQSNKPDIIDEI
ncbi:17712_t:CDS:2, partial [Racocetra persica]